MADPVVTTPANHPTRQFVYGQLSAANRQKADNVAAFMMAVQIIDGMPAEQRRTAIQKLNNGDWTGAVGDAARAVGAPIGWVAGQVSAGAAQVQSLAVQNGITGAGTLDIIGRFGSGALSVPETLAGIPPAMIADAKRYFAQERVGVAGRVWGTNPITEAAAREFGTAYASALQVRQNSHVVQPFFNGVRSNEWATYLSAGFSYLANYVSYAFNYYIMGDKSATPPDFGGLVQESRQKDDMPFVANALLSAGTIAGIKVTPALAQNVTQGGTAVLKDGSRVNAPAADQFGAAPLTPAAEQTSAGAVLGKGLMDHLQTPQGFAGAVVGSYVVAKVAPPAAHVAAVVGKATLNGAAATTGFVVKNAANAALGASSVVPDAAGVLLRVAAAPFPSSAKDIKAATMALEKDALKVGKEAANVAFPFMQRFGAGYDAAVKAGADAYKAERLAGVSADVFARAASGLDNRSVMMRVGDSLRGASNRLFDVSRSVGDVSVGLSSGIDDVTRAIKLKPSVVLLDDAKIAAKQAAAEAVAAQEAGREAARAAGLGRFSKDYAAVVKAGSEAYMAAAKAAPEMVKETVEVAKLVDAAEGTRSAGKMFKLGKIGGIFGGFFVAGGAATYAKAHGATGAQALDLGADIGPISGELNALRKGRPTEAALRLVDEVPLLGVSANLALRPLARGLGADVDPSAKEAIESLLKDTRTHREKIEAVLPVKADAAMPAVVKTLVEARAAIEASRVDAMVPYGRTARKGRVDGPDTNAKRTAYDAAYAHAAGNVEASIYLQEKAGIITGRGMEARRFDATMDALGTPPAQTATMHPQIRELIVLNREHAKLEAMAYGPKAGLGDASATVPDAAKIAAARKELEQVEARISTIYDKAKGNLELSSYLDRLSDPALAKTAAALLLDSVTGGIADEQLRGNIRPNAPMTANSTAIGAVIPH